MAPKKKGSFVKHTPNNQWFKNAVRSMGLAGADLIKDMVPAIYETGSSLYTVSKEARTALSSTSTRNLAKSISSMIENNTYTRMARNSVTNALSDLKTGKLYNKERMDKALEAELGLGDFDLDDIMSGSGDVDFGDISDDGIDVTINNNNVIGQSPEATAVMTSVLSDGLAQNANATLIASKAQTDTMIAVTSNAIASMQSTGDAIIRKLDSIDSNLSNLVTYMNDNVTKFIEASSKYYETMSAAQTASTAPGSTSVTGAVNPFTDHGGIDFKNFGKYVAANVKKMANESSVGALASMMTLSPSMIENGLIPALMKGGMKTLIPKVLQNSMSNIESIFQGFGETLLSRIADLSTNNNPILAAAGKVLGYKPDAKKGYDLTKFERGAIPFDGMTKHSIVEIIPRELRKIQEILTGKEAKIFDWTTGRYASPEEIRKNNRNLVRQEGITAMETSTFGNKMRERSALLSNAQDQEKFGKMLDTFYDNITKFEGYFDPNKKDSITAMLPNMEQEFGKAMSDFFVKAVQTAGEAAHMSINPAKNKGVRNRRRMMETMEDNPYEYNLFATEMDQGGIPTMTIPSVSSTARNRVSRNIRDRLFGTPAPTSGGVSGATASSVASTPRASRSTRFRGQRTRRTQRTALASGPSSDDGGPYLSGSIENYDADEIERRMRQQDQMTTDLMAMSQKSSVLNAPANKLSSGLNRAGNLMYKFAFGSGQDVANEILTRVGNALTGLADKIDENILQPLKHSLVGEKDQDGFSRGGVFSNVINSSKDFMNSVWSKFNGKSYKTSAGETVEGKPEESVMGSLRKSFNTIKEETMNFIFGKKNKETGKREGGQGFLAKAKESITTSLNKWSETLFGKRKDEDGREIATELSKELKERAPKAVATGIAGAGLGMLNGMGTFGLLGNLLLPGGPIGGAIVGSALGMLNQSDKFKNWLFGKTDDNGERTGGIISKQMQDFVKDNKTEIIGGAALGTMKSMILGGSGILSSIVGGPMAGALMGTAFALIKKSDWFQELLYGKGNPGDPDYKAGIITKFKEKMQTKDGKNRFGLVGTGAVGGAMAAGVVGNMGILGAALTPAGPIGGAIMGAGMGIAMASDKFRSLVFGELDEETGKRQGGLVQKFQNYISTELFTPAKLFMKGVALDTKDFIKDKMIEPLQMALDPIVEEFKYIGSKVREKVTEVATKITTSVKEVVLQPLGSALNKYLVDPLKKVGSTVFNAVFGVAKAILGAPFKAIGAFGNALVGRQTDRAARNEEEAIWNDPNRGILSKVKDTFILNASSRRRREVAEGQYEWMQGRDERAAERREQRLQERYSDRYTLETERMKAFDERFKTRAKGYDITSDAGLEALSRGDRRKVQREQDRRRKEGQKIDRLNASRLRRGLPLLKNPYAQDGIFYDVKSGAQHKKWLEKENSKRKARGEPTLNDPFTGEKGSGGATATTVAATSGTTVSGASSRRRVRRNADGSISQVPEESTASEASTVAETSSTEAAATSSSATSATTASTARRRAGAEAKASAADQKKTNGYIKDIRDEVNGQLNGVGSNINKIKRMLARALGVKDPDKDTGGDNKEYQSFADRFFNFMARPLHGITKMIATPFRMVAGIASSVKDAVGGAIQKVKELPGKIVEGFVGIAKGLGTAVGGLVRGLFSAGAKVIEGAWKGIGAAGNALLKGFTGLVTGAASALGSVIGGIADVGTALLNGAVQVVSTLPTLMASTAEALGSIARTGMSLISSAFHTVRTAITETAGLIKDTIVGAGKAIWHGITGIVGGIAGGIGSAAGFIGDKLGIGGRNRQAKVRYAGEIQRVIEPISVTNADKALRVIIEDFDNPVDLSSSTIHELRGYDDKGETVDSFSEFFGIDSSSGSGGSGKKFASVLKGLGIGVLGGAAGAAAGFFAGKKSTPEGPLEEGTNNASESNSTVKTPGASAVKNRRFRVAGVAGGIGALIGRQFDPDEAAEDREDAEAQKQKVAENTRKDADYMKGLIAEADAAAEEREMRQRMVSGIEKISTEQKSHNSIWDSIFSKKGLITGGLLLLAPIIMKFLNKFLGLDLGNLLSNIGTSISNVLSNWSFGIQNTDTAQEASEQKEEYADLLSGESGITGFILPEGEHDATSDSRLKMFTKPIERGIHFAKEGIIKAGKISSQGVGGAFARTTMSDRMAAGQIMAEKIKGAPGAIKNAAQRVVAPGTLGEDIALRGMYAADAVKNKASEVATKVSNSKVGQTVAKGAQKAGQAVSDTLTKLADTGAAKTVTSAAKGVASKITSAFDTFVSFMEKKIPSVAGKLSSVIKPIAEKIIGDETLLGKIGAKISAKVGAKGGLAAVTLGASEIVWAVIGAVDGATSASNMFACEKDAVDWKMIVISSAMKAALQTTVGTIFDIVDSILWATMGVSLVRSLAQIIYGVMASEEDVNALAESQQRVQEDYLAQVNEEKQAAYEEYVQNLEDPGTALTFEQWDAEYGDQVDVTSFADYNDDRNKTMFGKAADAVGKVGSAIKSGASSLWNGAKNIAGKVGGAIGNVVSGIGGGIKTAASAVGSGLKTAAGAVGNAAGAAWDKVKGVGSAISEKVNSITETVGPVVSDVVRTFSNAGKKIGGIIGDKVKEITAPIGEAFMNVKNAIGEKLGQFGSWVGEKWEGVREGVSTLVSNAGTAIGNAAQAFWDNTEPIREAASTAISKVKDGLGWVGNKVKEGADAIADKAGQMWDKLGGMWDDLKTNVGDFASKVKDNFQKGIDNLNSTVGSIFGFTDEDGNPVSFTDGIKSGVKSLATTISTKIGNVGIGIQNLWTRFSNWANDENEPLREYVGSGRGRGRSRGYRSLGFGRGSDVYNQLDAKWNTADPSMKLNGCGPTVAAMIANRYGRGLPSYANPLEANAMSYDLGMRDIDGGTNPAFFEQYGASKGISMKEGPVDKNLIGNNLAGNRPIALMGKGGAFGPGMHYLMADGIRGNNVSIVDPYGGTRKTSSLDNLVRNTSSAIYSGMGGLGRTIHRIFGRGAVQKNNKLDNNKLGNRLDKEKLAQEGARHGKVIAGGKGRWRIPPIGRFGRGTAKEQAAKVMQVAQGEVGYLEKATNASLNDKKANAGNNNWTKYGEWFGLNGGSKAPWCAMFVSWCLAQAGVSTSIAPKTAAVNEFYNFFKNKGTYHGKNEGYVPQTGDIIIMGGPSTHVGLVYSSDGQNVTTIEGNTSGQGGEDEGNGVYMKTYSMSDSWVYGFCTPAYDGQEVAFSGSSTSDSSTVADSGVSGNFFDKLSAGMSEIGNRLLEGATTGTYNTDFSSFFSSGSSSSSSSSGSSMSSGGEFPKYTDLSDEQKKFIAGVASAEQDSSDISAQRLEVSQMANLNEVEYKKGTTGADLVSTLKGGWYAQQSLNKANNGQYSPEALQAVEEVLVQGKRTLPRHVTEHDFYGDITNIDLNPSTSTGKENRRNLKQGTLIKNSMGSQYYFYKFAGKDGAEGSGDPFGSKPQYANQYQNDKPWGGGRFGRGRSALGTIARGRSSNSNTAYLEHAYRKSIFGRGVDDAYTTQIMQQAILNYLKVIAENTGSTVDAINGIEIPAATSSGIIYDGKTTNNVTVNKPTKTSGNSQSTQKMSRNEQIARAIARGTT